MSTRKCPQRPDRLHNLNGHAIVIKR
jgi:hypothetical protein